MFQWLTKIFFQLIYLETRLASDLSRAERGTILTADFVEQFRLEHLLLNSVRHPVSVAQPPPWSIFVFPAQVSTKHVRHNFDFIDNVALQVIAIRIGEVAIVASLSDLNVQEQMFRGYMGKFAVNLRLHPIQFRELACNVIYKTATMNRQPKFMTMWDDKAQRIQVLSLPLAGFSGRPVFDDWDQARYARLLHFYIGETYGFSFDQLYQPPHYVMTFLRTATGRYNRLDIDAFKGRDE